MDQIKIGSFLKELRQEKEMTQEQLAEQLNVSNRSVSRWETGKGFPDISLVETLAEALGISVIELFSGQTVTNQNVSANMLLQRVFYKNSANLARSASSIEIKRLQISFT